MLSDPVKLQAHTIHDCSVQPQVNPVANDNHETQKWPRGQSYASADQIVRGGIIFLTS